MKQKFLILLLLILISRMVFSIALTPPELNIIYDSEKEVGCGFNFSPDKEGDISFRVEGDLKDSIDLTSQNFKVKKNAWYSSLCVIKLPANLSPGPHEANIIVVEGKNPGGVGAVAGIIFPVRIFVPYPGKYLDIKRYNLNDIAIDDIANFKLEVISRGEEKINNAKAEIIIKDKAEKIYGKTQSNSISLEKNQEGTLLAEWNSSGTPAGIYDAEAVVFYDNKQAKESKEMKIGELRVDILDIKYDKALTNSIIKFDLNLKSVWNSPITDAFLTLDIFDGNNKFIKEIKGENFEIGPWLEIEKSIFWDTKGLEPGKYKGTFKVIHSNGRSSEKTIRIDLNQSFFNKYPVVSISLILIVIILRIILIINIKKNKR